MCCLQQVRWREQGARMVGMGERKYKLWWSSRSDWVGGVRVMVKEELCERVMEVRRMSDRVMTVALFLKRIC